jgi:hypothetical protein
MTVRTYDEAHLQRLLRAKLAECGGKYLRVDKALGLPRAYTYNVLVMHKRVNERVARALGFRKQYPGTARVYPIKFVRLMPDSPPATRSE